MGTNQSRPRCASHASQRAKLRDGTMRSHDYSAVVPQFHILEDDDASTSSDSDSEGSTEFGYEMHHENLIMLPSKVDPLGRTIRRVTTEIVDADEQLELVKRRASAARSIALHSRDSSVARGGENSQLSQENRTVTPKDFEYIKVIGVGGMGRVVLVRNRQDDKLYAMKVVSKSTVLENNLVEKILSERDVLGGTHHHSLVHLHWAFQTKNSLFLVMDYCPGGEISLHLRLAERFTEEVAMFYAAELVLALEHLHRHGIVYRDLKPENILLSEAGHLKLVDFGISKFGITEATKGAKTLCGSYEYLAPEVFERSGYGTAVDWWSLGAVMYELLTGLPPWYSQDWRVMRKRIIDQPLHLPSYLSEEAKDLLRGLLNKNPLDRLGSSGGSVEIKRHHFFRNIDWQMITFREVYPPIRPCESTGSIEDASNFDAEFTRLSIGSVDSSICGSYDDFKGFNFEAPQLNHIEYGYSRDLASKRGSRHLSNSSANGP